jgi:hypothetical protein
METTRCTRLACSAAVAIVLVSGCSTQGSIRRSGSGGQESESISPPEAAPNAQGATDVCGPGVEWCHAPAGRIPSRLRRPLRLPHLRPGDPCPASRGRRYANRLFGGITFGRGPVRPLVAPNNRRDAGPARSGILRFRRAPENRRWFRIKTLWFARPSYRGPAFIRGRQLDGDRRVVFGERPELVDPYLAPGPTVNGGDGFREWPGATWLRAEGCYALRIDGRNFSSTIVFAAEL